MSDSFEDEKDNRVSLVWTVALLILVSIALVHSVFGEKFTLLLGGRTSLLIIYILLASVGVISVLKDAELG